ncbi:hypothetical protein BT63DRAFT_460629 [Microthyrium microscopicum]|uniref:Uncharacterized protein n=1 Tax=Microthyrium microscopicum TaxID=703497 RepID=A0A6A6TYT9_9PEZI|nr:hypothetical protein BT63DRAFT_460629 [Microthyrium microscopicum]
MVRRTQRSSGGLFSRRRRAPAHSHQTVVVETVPAHHQHRRASIGDKVSGALMKLRGTLTRRPGLKAAGTRRMHGTDGRGSHRTYY